MRFRLEGNGPESHQVRRAGGVFRVSSYLFQLRPLYPCCSLREVVDFLKTVRSPEHRLAWLVAIAADAIQIGALPLFAAGGLSPADFFFQAEDGIRDLTVTGVQTCALPI